MAVKQKAGRKYYSKLQPRTLVKEDLVWWISKVQPLGWNNYPESQYQIHGMYRIWNFILAEHFLNEL